jgi:hypothetical protein
MSWPCVSPISADRCALLVAVIPNAKRSEVVGLHDGALRVRLAAPAIEGRANEALIAWLADQLGLRQRELELKQGQSARRKRLLIDCAASRVEAWLDGLGLA